MGNKYSVVRGEEEEAEYEQLVRAVQAAQKRAQREVDLEANIDLNDQRHTRRPHYSHHVASPPVVVSQTVYLRAHTIAPPSSFVNIANPSSAEDSMVMTDAKAGDSFDESVQSPSQSVIDSALHEHREYKDPQHIEPSLTTLRRTTPPHPASPSHHRHRKGLSVRTGWERWTAGSPRTEGGVSPTAHNRSPSLARVPVVRGGYRADFIEEDHDKEGSQKEQLARVTNVLSNALVRRQPGTLGKQTRAASLSKQYTEKYASEVDFVNVTEFMLEKDVDLDIKSYPDLPHAAGLRTGKKCSEDGQWQPMWAVFPLKVFRGGDWVYLKIQPQWEDERLLCELSKTYDRLRTVWRKWFSLRSVGSIVMVLADHSVVYPQRVGTTGLSPSKNMRLRYFLHHPEAMRGRHEFLQVLTDNPKLGVEFVERWQVSRIAIAVLIPVIMSVVVGVVYSGLTGDASTAFTIAVEPYKNSEIVMQSIEAFGVVLHRSSNVVSVGKTVTPLTHLGY
ncbi:hypothetical protein CERSUDRAFT_95896 [Gelatoporia subvermispora B]|uniref:Uncharacterized protein n=1 Tax=Ceriporiopsis subvermispora (strain B) TaxID=914234 RepID=M2RCS6_CERS8|nr:hypothetical protein CERSUDRAFT_95896 [Gelatoporia subvermispora B]